MDKQLRRLVRDVKNPQHDKRHRYGLQSIPVFKVGTVIEHAPESAWQNDKGEWRALPARVYVGCHLVQNIDEMLDASEPCEPKTFREVVIEAGHNNMDAFALDALEAMITDGVISIETARRYVRAQLD